MDPKQRWKVHGAGVVAKYPTGGVFVVLGGNLGFSVLTSAAGDVHFRNGKNLDGKKGNSLVTLKNHQSLCILSVSLGVPAQTKVWCGLRVGRRFRCGFWGGSARFLRFRCGSRSFRRLGSDRCGFGLFWIWNWRAGLGCVWRSIGDCADWAKPQRGKNVTWHGLLTNPHATGKAQNSMIYHQMFFQDCHG